MGLPALRGSVAPLGPARAPFLAPWPCAPPLATLAEKAEYLEGEGSGSLGAIPGQAAPACPWGAC